MGEFQILQLIALIMVAVLVFPSVRNVMKRSSGSAILRNIAIWLGLFAVVALLYQFYG